MPLAIPNTTLADDYSDATTFGKGDVFAWGFFTVANNPAFVRLFEGERGVGVFQPEVYCPPATYPIAGGVRPISGISAKNAVAGSPAQFFGSMFYPREPGIQAGTPFTATVSASGVVGGVGEVAYQEITANVGVTGARADIIVCPAFTLDVAAQIVAEFYCEKLTQNNAASTSILNLRDGATDLGDVWTGQIGVAGFNFMGCYLRTSKIALAAGAHTIAIQGRTTAGTLTTVAGVGGGAGINLPAYLRVSVV